MALATNLSWPGKSQKLELEREEMPCLNVYKSRGNVCFWHGEVVQDELAMDLFIQTQVGFDIQYGQKRDLKKKKKKPLQETVEMVYRTWLGLCSCSFQAAAFAEEHAGRAS